MTNIPIELREKLALHFNLKSVTIEKSFISEIDGTRKYLLKMSDGVCVEAVFMQYKHGNTACISTQAGCRMGCKFCASTVNGRERDLSPAEMLGQVVAIQNHSGERISNIVLMGMGEPLDNYANVIDFLHIINSKEGLNISLRNISLSTCGVVDKIYDLADEGLPVTLSISLHETTDTARSMIMPINKKFNIQALMKACRHYANVTKRRISFEYVLIDGQNDTKEHAEQLAKLVRGMIAHINLIPINNIGKDEFKASKNIKNFQKELERLGINATVRRTLGSDISASCGQLAGRLK